jgi:hypothetical protein
LNTGIWPKIHFWGWNLGALGLVAGLFLMFSGKMQFVMLASISSIVVFLSMVVFALQVFRTKLA